MYELTKRAARYVLCLFAIASLNFLIPRFMPGDPMLHLIGEDVSLSPEELSSLRAEFGLDKPLGVQYARYWRDLLRLDLGYSYHYHQGVRDLVTDRAGWTLLLAGTAIVLGATAGSVLGALAGWHSSHAAARAGTLGALVAYATPPYLLAILLLYGFSFKLGLFPLKAYYETGGIGDVIRHLALPALVLSTFTTARNFMIMRGSVIQEKSRLYVTFARAKGLLGRTVLFRHVFANASLPLITLVALDFGFVLGGALVVEIVFSLNGMGSLIYDALNARDYPVLQGAFLVITMMVVAANMVADLAYALVDPRVRRPT